MSRSVPASHIDCCLCLCKHAVHVATGTAASESCTAFTQTTRVFSVAYCMTVVSHGMLAEAHH